ncbi:MAG: nucleotidyl transferase AbiEii/AbiGii toxin family protein [Deltaproteobacteria bacterium]|nr:nucleotidyl transferase AbiEii/AbiGii toxin family protein [Deltaproteobacteria bacterium]
MNSLLQDSARAIINLLDERTVRYARVGGFAVSMRTVERMTKDIDFAVAIDNDDQAESLIKELLGIGYEIDTVLENTKAKRLATMRLKAVNSGVIIDFIFASCGIENEVVQKATEEEVFPGLLVKVATIACLIAMKLVSANDSTRIQDIIDLRNLKQEATEIDLAEVKKLVALITSRGFNQDKDLQQIFSKI